MMLSKQIDMNNLIKCSEEILHNSNDKGFQNQTAILGFRDSYIMYIKDYFSLMGRN